MKRNYGFIILSLIAVLVLFASCEQTAMAPAEPEVDHGDVVEVGMVILEDKVLGSEINSDIKYWEFMATPLFELGEGEHIYGTVSYWRVLAELNTGEDNVVKKTANLGRYTSGKWRFELRALNSEKHVIAVGSKEQVVREGLDNTINITVYTDNADNTNGQSIDDDSRYTGWDGHTEESKTETTVRYGQLHVGIVVNQLDENVYQNMQIVTKYQKIDKTANLGSSENAAINWNVRKGAVAPTIDSTGNVVVQGVEGEKYTNWYKEATPNNYRVVTGDNDARVELGKVYYEGVLENLDAGSYIFTFYIQGKDKNGSWINLGGQAVDVMIIGGEETLVKGTVLANEYVMAGLKITAPGTIYGTINGKNYAVVDGRKPITLTWQQTGDEAERSGEAPARYYWYVEGAPSLTTSPTFTFQVPTDGDEPIYGIYRVTCVPTGNLGSTGTSTIDVICNPDVGPNVGEFDWNNVPGI